MFNLGFSEIFVLSIIALLVIGPKQLPEVARTLGRLLNELKRATGDMSKSFLDAKNQVEDFTRETQTEVKEKLSAEKLGRLAEKNIGVKDIMAKEKDEIKTLVEVVEGKSLSDDKK